MKLRRGSIKTLLLGAVGCFGFSVFLLVDTLHRENNLGEKSGVRDLSQDGENGILNTGKLATEIHLEVRR